MSARRWVIARRLVPAMVLALGLSACAGVSGTRDLGRVGPSPTPEPTEAATLPTPAPPECDDATASYPALEALPGPDALPEGSTMARIKERGTLVAGVSADTLLLGARNPFTGSIEGFDIDVLRDLSTAIFGDPDHVTFRVITSGDRIPALQEGQVDVVARALTMTCGRWQQIGFSTVYLQAGQKLLVPHDSEANGLEDLAGERVCAPAGTTTLARLEDYAVEPQAARTHTQCLVLLQRGLVDAIAGDDTILAGFAAQDPQVKVVGDAISAEPYGLGFPAAAVDLIEFANAVLAQRVSDGRWTESYDRWLAPALGEQSPPVPDYGRAP